MKNICRACDGDGFLAVAPEHERVTRDSRRCTYCNGTGKDNDAPLPTRIANSTEKS